MAQTPEEIIREQADLIAKSSSVTQEQEGIIRALSDSLRMVKKQAEGLAMQAEESGDVAEAERIRREATATQNRIIMAAGGSVALVMFAIILLRRRQDG